MYPSFLLKFNELIKLPKKVSDCYDGRMNYANPILICDENEEFRILIRDMLTKNGFFHVLEAASASEAKNYLEDKKEYFLLVHAKALSSDLLNSLSQRKSFIVFSHVEDERTVTLSARLGVEHFMSYPFHSKKLLEKIKRLL